MGIPAISLPSSSIVRDQARVWLAGDLRGVGPDAFGASRPEVEWSDRSEPIFGWQGEGWELASVVGEGAENVGPWSPRCLRSWTATAFGGGSTPSSTHDARFMIAARSNGRKSTTLKVLPPFAPSSDSSRRGSIPGPCWVDDKR